MNNQTSVPIIAKLREKVENFLKDYKIITILATSSIFLASFLIFLNTYNFDKVDNFGTITVEPFTEQVIETPSKPSKGKKSAKAIAYFEKWLDHAKSESKKYGIPVSISLAQTGAETGYGTSTLCKTAHNFAGINYKGKPTEYEKQLLVKGKYWVEYDDDKTDKKGNPIPSKFYNYKSDWSGWRHYMVFFSGRIKNHPNYKQLQGVPLSDYKTWAVGLEDAGWATSDHYSELLVKIIELYELDQYDK